MMNQSFQGVTPAQTELISHWYALAARSKTACPPRDLVNPGALRTHLAHLSILEMDGAGQARFRIAGSRLHDILDMDPRGRSLGDLPVRLAEMWALGLEAAIERREPVGGVMADRSGSRRHAWLRLPLVDVSGRTRLILCHDQLVCRSDEAVRRPVHDRRRPIAA